MKKKEGVLLGEEATTTTMTMELVSLLLSLPAMALLNRQVHASC